MENITVREALDMLDKARERAKGLYFDHMEKKVSNKNPRPHVEFFSEVPAVQDKLKDIEGNPEMVRLYITESIFVEYLPYTVEYIPGYIKAVWYNSDDDDIYLDVYDMNDGNIKTVLARFIEESELVCEFLNKYDNAGLNY